MTRKSQTQEIAELETEPEQSEAVATGELTAEIVRDRYKHAVKAIEFDRKEYQLNKLFVEGQQWVKWVDKTKAFVPWKRQGDRYQATVNKLDNLVATYLGKAIKADFEYEVPPSTADDYAVEGALLATAVVRYKNQASAWEDRREELSIAALLGGTAALATEWDAGAKAYGSVNTGDTVETVLNITQFAIEPGAKNARKARWWVKAQVLPPEEVRAKYKMDYTPKPDSNFGSPSGSLSTNTSTSTTERGTLVVTYYERPNFLRPEGAVAVLVDNRLVWGPKSWPFPFKDHLNLDVVRETVVDDQWNGVTRLTKARPIQVQYNFVHSNIQDHIKKVGVAKPIAPYGSAEVFDQWNDDPATPLLYPDGSTPPGYLQPPSLPGYIQQQLDRLENDMMDAVGVHAISQGEAPANIESGFGLQTLAENDGSPATAMAKRTARVFVNTASDVLEMYSKNIKETRTATVYEPNGNIAQSIKWSGKTLAGQTHVVIPIDAIIPQSRAAMQQFAQTIAGMGLLPPGQQGLTLLLEIAQVPNRDETMWYVNPAEARSRHDVARVFQGEIVVPREFHDHQTAITVGNRARMSPRYDATTDKIRKALDLWILTHQRFAEEQAGQQLGRAGMSPALANTPTANAAAPLPAELMGISPNQPAALMPPTAQVPEGNSPSIPQQQGDTENG
jgi:hypothetical protein